MQKVDRRRSFRKSLVIELDQIQEFSPLRRKSIVVKSQDVTPPSKSICLPSPARLTASQPAPNPISMRMLKDYNSPSATSRIKASKAMKSPGFRRLCYGSISNNVETPILEEEKSENRAPSPVKIPEIRAVFDKCRVYVEVRSGCEDRSGGIRSRLIKEGIQVDERLNKATTHVIFKDGLLSTYKQAKKQGAAIVNLLWVDTCLKQKRLLDTERFKITNIDRYENPELYKRMRGCRKSLQLNIDYRDAMGTPDKFSKTSHEQVDMNLTAKNAATVDESKTMTPSTPQQQQKTIVNSTAMSIVTPNHTNLDNSTMSFATPIMSATAMSEKKKIVFNSLGRISSVGRRSIVEIGLQRITDNCNRSMNSISDRHLIHTPKLNSSLRTQTLKKRKIVDVAASAGTQDDKENSSMNKAKQVKVDKKSTTAAQPNSIKRKTDITADSRMSISQYFKPTAAKKTAMKESKPPQPQLKRIVCTNMLQADKKILHEAIVNLGGVVEDAVTRTTTHVISPTIDRTMNILRGVVRACLIVDTTWIHSSLAAGKFVDATVHQHVISDANRFFERSVLGSKYRNTTFSTAGLFYLYKESFDHPEKKCIYLREVIELCDGKLTDDIKKATIVVNDGDVQTMKTVNPKARQLKSSSIFDSAMSGKFV